MDIAITNFSMKEIGYRIWKGFGVFLIDNREYYITKSNPETVLTSRKVVLGNTLSDYNKNYIIEYYHSVKNTVEIKYALLFIALGERKYYDFIIVVKEDCPEIEIVLNNFNIVIFRGNGKPNKDISEYFSINVIKEGGKHNAKLIKHKQ